MIVEISVFALLIVRIKLIIIVVSDLFVRFYFLSRQESFVFSIHSPSLLVHVIELGAMNAWQLRGLVVTSLSILSIPTRSYRVFISQRLSISLILTSSKVILVIESACVLESLIDFVYRITIQSVVSRVDSTMGGFPVECVIEP
jgi:hypothetical protein